MKSPPKYDFARAVADAGYRLSIIAPITPYDDSVLDLQEAIALLDPDAFGVFEKLFDAHASAAEFTAARATIQMFADYVGIVNPGLAKDRQDFILGRRRFTHPPAPRLCRRRRARATALAAAHRSAARQTSLIVQGRRNRQIDRRYRSLTTREMERQRRSNDSISGRRIRLLMRSPYDRALALRPTDAAKLELARIGTELQLGADSQEWVVMVLYAEATSVRTQQRKRRGSADCATRGTRFAARKRYGRYKRGAHKLRLAVVTSLERARATSSADARRHDRVDRWSNRRNRSETFPFRSYCNRDDDASRGCCVEPLGGERRGLTTEPRSLHVPRYPRP